MDVISTVPLHSRVLARIFVVRQAFLRSPVVDIADALAIVENIAGWNVDDYVVGPAQSTARDTRPPGRCSWPRVGCRPHARSRLRSEPFLRCRDEAGPAVQPHRLHRLGQLRAGCCLARRIAHRHRFRSTRARVGRSPAFGTGTVAEPAVILRPWHCQLLWPPIGLPQQIRNHTFVRRNLRPAHDQAWLCRRHRGRVIDAVAEFAAEQRRVLPPIGGDGGDKQQPPA